MGALPHPPLHLPLSPFLVGNVILVKNGPNITSINLPRCLLFAKFIWSKMILKITSTDHFPVCVGEVCEYWIQFWDECTNVFFPIVPVGGGWYMFPITISLSHSMSLTKMNWLSQIWEVLSTFMTVARSFSSMYVIKPPCCKHFFPWEIHWQPAIWNRERSLSSASQFAWIHMELNDIVS